MKKIIEKDVIGKKYGRLTIIDLVWENHRCWSICNCDCGKQVKVRHYAIVNGSTKSCGCYKREVLKDLLSTCSSKDPRLYTVWKSMKQRCTNPNSPHYKNYGMRGIHICKEWNNYEHFYEWAISHGYKKGLTIERIDNDGDYCPENCCWADRKTQVNNRRNTVFYTMNNQTKPLSKWCDEYGMKYSLVRQRVYNMGWELEKALTTPSCRSKKN